MGWQIKTLTVKQAEKAWEKLDKTLQEGVKEE